MSTTSIGTILCPGPSLASWPVAEIVGKSNVSIAVNEAASLAPAAWWAFGDETHLLKTSPSGSPRPFMGDEGLRRARRKPQLAEVLGTLGDPMVWSVISSLHPRPPEGWSIYSATAAIALAKWLGATDIRLFGCDHDGSASFTGETPPGVCRTPERWGNEARIMGQMAEWVARDGATLRRFMPGHRWDDPPTPWDAESLTREELTKYRTVYGTWKNYGGKCHGAPWIDRIGDLRGKRLLDIGTGDGAFVSMANQRGGLAFGIDLASQAPGVIAAPAHRIPFPSSHFPLVTAFDVLEHLPDPLLDRSLAEVVRVMADYGRFAATISYEPHVYNGATLHEQVHPPEWWGARLEASGLFVEERDDKFWMCRK